MQAIEHTAELTREVEDERNRILHSVWLTSLEQGITRVKFRVRRRLIRDEEAYSPEQLGEKLKAAHDCLMEATRVLALGLREVAGIVGDNGR